MSARRAGWWALGGPAPAWVRDYPKIEHLQRLAAHTRLVPPAWVTQDPAKAPPPLSDLPGPWILRSVMPHEDSASHQRHSGTGLALSIGQLTDQAGIEAAMQHSRTHLEKLQHAGVLAHRPELAFIVQTQIIARHYLLVIRWEDASGPQHYAELYPPVQDPFTGHHTPQREGELEEVLPAPDTRAHLAQILPQIHAQIAAPAAEIELIQDTQDRWWCVQAKPCRKAPFVEHQAFMAAAMAQNPRLADYPCLHLDAEHNPEPLSAAHAWLIGALAPSPPRYLVLAGWLYLVPRDEAPSRPAPSARDQLKTLRDRSLPAAHRALDDWQARWGHCSTQELAPALDDALDLCRRILDSCPSPPSALAAKAGASYPTTLIGREDYAHLLPTRWDIAAPTLTQAKLPPRGKTARPQPPLPDDESLATQLLAEWDDHLFALALRPLRELWLRAGNLLDINTEDIFALDAPTLLSVASGKLAKDKTLRAALQRQQAQAKLVAPMQLRRGRPRPMRMATRLRGLGFGSRVSGPLHPRADIEALLADPPPPGSILAMPALTAPCALALDRLQIQALVCEHGGMISHGARMAQELGLSALIGCQGCMQIPSGENVVLDPAQGRLFVGGA